ncbi:MAG TPA: 30S ribosome-binding factor RbfA [Egibacteraceae bacterium]|jgi:ribosome-binding factor A|nr:30S ribosome-binding factor RbfA [Egibacteraceae bacterium]
MSSADPQRPAAPARTRMRRVNESVKEVLASLLVDMKDPRIGFVTLTEVRTTPDLKQAEVFYTVLPDDDATRTDTAEGLESATPLLRRELGARLRMKSIPRLDFTLDPVPARGRRIETLLRDQDPVDGDR